MKKLIMLLFMCALCVSTIEVLAQDLVLKPKLLEKTLKKLKRCDGKEQWAGYIETPAGRTFFFHRKDLIEAHWHEFISDSLTTSHERRLDHLGFMAMDQTIRTYSEVILDGDLNGHTKPKKEDPYDQIFLELLQEKGCPSYIDITYKEK